MKTKIVVAMMVTLFLGETFAAALPSSGRSTGLSARSAELIGLPASPHQWQVLGLSRLEGAKDTHADVRPIPDSWADTYRGVPASPHQLEVLGSSA